MAPKLEKVSERPLTQADLMTDYFSSRDHDCIAQVLQRESDLQCICIPNRQNIPKVREEMKADGVEVQCPKSCCRPKAGLQQVS